MTDVSVVDALEAARRLSAQRNDFDPLGFMVGLGGAPSGALASVAAPLGSVLRETMGVNAVKPLTEAQFYKKYSQHINLRQGDLQSILENGFQGGANVNTLPPYRGGPPSNIIESAYAPRAGQQVFLVPNDQLRPTGNGYVIRDGWKPQPHEVLTVSKDFPSMYEEYLSAISRR